MNDCRLGAAPEPLAALYDQLTHAGRQVARAEADLIATVHAIMTATPDDWGPVADQVAFAMGWSRQMGASHVQLAHILHGLPAVAAAFTAGDIDLRKVRMFTDVLADVPASVAEAVAAKVVPDAGRLAPGQIRDRLIRRLTSADPDFVARRRAAAVAGRRLQLQPEPDGTAMVLLLGVPGHKAAHAFERVDAIAKARIRAGGQHRLDQLRADVALDLLSGTEPTVTPTARRGVLDLSIGIETLAGLNNEAGILGRYGPIAADIARQMADAMAHTAQLQAAVYGQDGELLFTCLPRTRPTPAIRPTPASGPTLADDPAPAVHRPPQAPAPTYPAKPTQQLVAPALRTPTDQPNPDAQHHATKPDNRMRPTVVDPPNLINARPMPPPQDPVARFPNAAMNRWIKKRDKHCRAPGCRRQARFCDIDHINNHATGGPTTDWNLATLCRYHHRLKHRSQYRLTQPRPGHFRWTTPTGHHYDIPPEPP